MYLINENDRRRLGEMNQPSYDMAVQTVEEQVPPCNVTVHKTTEPIMPIALEKAIITDEIKHVKSKKSSKSTMPKIKHKPQVSDMHIVKIKKWRHLN